MKHSKAIRITAWLSAILASLHMLLQLFFILTPGISVRLFTNFSEMPEIPMQSNLLLLSGALSLLPFVLVSVCTAMSASIAKGKATVLSVLGGLCWFGSGLAENGFEMLAARSSALLGTSDAVAVIGTIRTAIGLFPYFSPFSLAMFAAAMAIAFCAAEGEEVRA